MTKRNTGKSGAKESAETLDLTTGKGRIVAASLKLFAESGYHAVSVRDIAREVGIKDASIYSHFASKDEILDTIVSRFTDAFFASIPGVEEFDEIFRFCDARGFLRKGVSLFRKRVEDPTMAQTYLVLIRERFDNPQAAAAWKAHRERSVDYVAAAFSAMMRKKVLPEGDPHRLARLYEYPHFLMVEEYVLKACRGEDPEPVASEMLAHTDFFVALVKDKKRK